MEHDKPPSLIEEARLLLYKGDNGSAIAKLSEHLNGDFYDPEALHMLGYAFMSQGANGIGAVLTSAAIDAREASGKHFPEAMLNLGTAYKHQHCNDIAQKIWTDALKYEKAPKDRAKLYGAMSSLYIHEGQPAKAIEFCDRALKEDPRNYGAMANRGMACLELGRWREGWEGFAATYLTGDRNERNYPEIPVWDGSPDKTVIVWGDQGVGDEIFFANSLPDMIARSKRVIFDCHPRLDKLFARSFPAAVVHGTRKHITGIDWLDDCRADAAVGLSDLPRYFRNDDADWRNEPYLKAAPMERSAKLRIGISWTGGTKKTRSDLRCIPLAMMEPIIRARPDAEWFSLQYTPDAAREVCEFEERTGLRIAHFPGMVECFDYDRTASFVGSLDLVITVCTTVHHLGGALGVPTWTLVPSRPSWRYQGSGETLPWYRSARLFRQTTDRDWSGAVDSVVKAIGEF